MTGQLEAGLRDRAERALRARRSGTRLGELAPLPGGVSSLTYESVLDGEQRVVVKVAPPALPPVRNRDVLRQARLLTALHRAPGVHVPEVLATDDGSPPLFVMSFVAGQAYEPKWDLSDAPPAPAVVRRRGLAAARMLADLQRVDPAAVGIGDEPALSLSQELERWSALYATVGEELRGEERALARALAERMPNPVPARISHGDYRLGNMQFDGERLAAIIDWELWSVGDPRADLAWLMMFANPVAQRVRAEWRDAANQAAAEAMPGSADVLAAFIDASSTSQPPAGLVWFAALSAYKLGAAMAVLAKRNRRVPRPDPGLELVAQTSPAMLADAVELLALDG
ncbi:MAG: phosphotransferase family protein [Solirubrobacteraceae bacterium]